MSLWDQFELFLAVDAAGLAIPTNDSEKKALSNKMRDSYEKAVDEVFSKYFELTYPDSQVNSNKVRYRSIDDPLPERLFYSRALDMQGRVLFRPDPSDASSKLFQEWCRDKTDEHYAFSSKFEVQKFDRKEIDRWLAFHNIGSDYSFIKTGLKATGIPQSSAPLDVTVLATPDRLLSVFGQWGFKKNWFDSPRKQAWLWSARKQNGIGGNSPSPPLYCPHEVMVGLANKIKRSKGAPPRISEVKGWQILKRQFPATYDKFQSFEVVDDQS
jgi:hypothetical protein